jgi:hypothetical protein
VGVAVQVGYLQSPVLTYGQNFATFQFRAWDGEANSRSNCVVTINVYSVSSARLS